MQHAREDHTLRLGARQQFRVQFDLHRAGRPEGVFIAAA
jgi:hypothetical protein